MMELLHNSPVLSAVAAMSVSADEGLHGWNFLKYLTLVLRTYIAQEINPFAIRLSLKYVSYIQLGVGV